MAAVDEEKRRKYFILQTYCKVRDHDCENCIFDYEKAWCTYKSPVALIRNHVIDEAMEKLVNPTPEVEK